MPFNDDESLYGLSDYTDVKEVVAEWIRRQSGISHALDKHNNPHLAVPAGSIQQDENGQIKIDMEGMVFPIPEGGEAPEYVTWDAMFEAHADQISRIKDQFHFLSDISAVLFDPSLSVGVRLVRL